MNPAEFLLFAFFPPSSSSSVSFLASEFIQDVRILIGIWTCIRVCVTES